MFPPDFCDFGCLVEPGMAAFVVNVQPVGELETSGGNSEVGNVQNVQIFGLMAFQTLLFCCSSQDSNTLVPYRILCILCNMGMYRIVYSIHHSRFFFMCVLLVG